MARFSLLFTFFPVPDERPLFWKTEARPWNPFLLLLCHFSFRSSCVPNRVTLLYGTSMSDVTQPRILPSPIAFGICKSKSDIRLRRIENNRTCSLQKACGLQNCRQILCESISDGRCLNCARDMRIRCKVERRSVWDMARERKS